MTGCQTWGVPEDAPEGGRERGRKGGREGGREGEREGGREERGGREEGRREGGRKGQNVKNQAHKQYEPKHCSHCKLQVNSFSTVFGSMSGYYMYTQHLEPIAYHSTLTQPGPEILS